MDQQKLGRVRDDVWFLVSQMWVTFRSLVFVKLNACVRLLLF
jgi:hypothetical protein